jgi:hypothetical protein
MYMIQAGEQGNVPFLVIRPKLQHSMKEVLRRPAVICLHSTGRSKESMRPFMEVIFLFLFFPSYFLILF